MITLLCFVLLLILPLEIKSFLCSAYCGAGNCTGITSNNCTDCQYPWYLNVNTCQFNTSSQYQLFAQQSAITVNYTNSTTQGAYSFRGWFYYFREVKFRHSGVHIPHYAIRIVMWVILSDDWSTTNYIRLNFDSTYKYRYYNTFDGQENLTYRTYSQLEKYYRIDQQWTHTSDISSIQFQIQTSSSSFQYYGFKQYMILVAKCHDYCQQCTSQYNDDCSQCVSPYRLSGSTCDTDCLPGYGISNNATLCLLCSAYCTQCSYVLTNCSGCQTSGTFESYLYLTSCITSCPSKYVEVDLTHTCQPCSDSDCLECQNDLTTCYQCDTNYWFNFSCYAVCPNGYFQDVANCTACDSSCSICDGDPSPCTQCTTGNYLYNNACGPCPANYFAHVPTRVCRDCPTYCVTATLTIYLTNTPSVQIRVEFSENVNFSQINYQNLQTISMNDSSISWDKFGKVYTIIDSRSYTITLTPKNMILLENVQFSVQLNDPNTVYYSQDQNKFSDDIYTLNDSLIWSYLKGPQPSDEQQIIIGNIDKINDRINQFFGQQYLQEIKKTGILCFFLPGIQISTSAILHNGKPAQNMYEMVRFFGSFVFFEVPSWQENGSQTQYIFSQKINDILSPSSRLLQSTTNTNQTDFWRYTRTGHTTYFIFDTYMQLTILVLCWIIVLLLHLMKKKCPKIVGPGYTFLHRAHQVLIFYIWIGALLEWLVFQTQSQYKEISLAISIIASLYFLFYELYVFYRLIPYPFVQLMSKKFSYYVERYSFFLRDLRYEEYKHLSKWSLRHLLRPYNYQILSFFRLLMILAALPLFSDFSHGGISCLVAIQSLQIVRFLLTWPFFQLWRNIYRLVMEISLLLFFILYLIDDILITQFFQDVNAITNEQITFYYILGWIGFSFLILYNAGFLIYLIIDIVYCYRYTNRYRMQLARRCYYKQLLKDYEAHQTLLQKQEHWKITEHRSSFVKMLNTFQDVSVVPAPTNKRSAIEMIARKGNLDQINYDKLQTIQVKIEQYEIRQTFKVDEYQITSNKVPALYMHINPKKDRKENIFIPDKKTKVFIMNPTINVPYYVIVDHLFKKYSSVSTKIIVLKTFVIVDQSLYQPGVQIPIDDLGIVQNVQVKSISKSQYTEKLNNTLPGFPIPNQLLQQL